MNNSIPEVSQQWITRGFVAVMLITIASTIVGCGTHPTALYSAQDIRRASKDTERIRIGFLPISDYPLLSKFVRLKDVDFFTTKGTGANDKKLEALAKLQFDGLEGISLLNCPAVTDAGIRHLSGIGSLRHMQLEGTSITDEALETMKFKMKLRGINVSNCPNVTMKGLLNLAASETLTEFGFSSDGLTQETVTQIISKSRTISWCGIVDPRQELDAEALKRVGQERGITIVITRTGALQDLEVGGR